MVILQLDSNTLQQQSNSVRKIGKRDILQKDEKTFERQKNEQRKVSFDRQVHAISESEVYN